MSCFAPPWLAGCGVGCCADTRPQFGNSDFEPNPVPEGSSQTPDQLYSNPTLSPNPAEPSPSDNSTPATPKKGAFFQHNISALTYMGSRQGLRVEWEFRLCSPWPDPKILLLIKLSRASLSVQAPRAPGLPPRVMTLMAAASPRSWRICQSFAGN